MEWGMNPALFGGPSHLSYREIEACIKYANKQASPAAGKASRHF